MPVDVVSLPKMADLTAINVDATKKEVDYLIDVAKTYSFASTFTPPYYTSYVREHLEGSDVLTGAVAAFPSGAEATAVKVFATKDRIAAGAQEVDIVMNVGEFKSGNFRYVADDLKAVADVCNQSNVALKVIIETALLNNDEILQAGERCV